MQVTELDDETLELVAKNGEMNYEKWPALLEPLLERLDQIVHQAFPIPTIPPPLFSQPYIRPSNEPRSNSDTLLPSNETLSTTESLGGQENGPITLPSPRPLPPVPAFDSPTTSRIPDSLPASQTQPGADTIPDLLIQQLNYITQTIRTCFSEKPPHTIQRFAELVLAPTTHYKTLPAWLRAVDRVVSVSSTADIFPLPVAQPLPGGVVDSSLSNGIINGVSSGPGSILWTNNDSRNGYDSGLGSDESLGGALLTPIPWLKNGVTSNSTEMSSPISDPLGDALEANAGNVMVPERTDGAVTQGELIRQEQEAGIVPVSQTMGSRRTPDSGAEDGDLEDPDAMPHARGPDIVGAEDIGLQGGRNMEVSIGGRTDVQRMDENPGGHVQKPSAAEGVEVQAEAQTDEDIVLTDVDGKTDEQADEKADASGENVGPDAADTSAV